jgi:hypothetical protein
MGLCSRVAQIGPIAPPETPKADATPNWISICTTPSATVTSEGEFKVSVGSATEMGEALEDLVTKLITWSSGEELVGFI